MGLEQDAQAEHVPEGLVPISAHEEVENIAARLGRLFGQRCCPAGLANSHVASVVNGLRVGKATIVTTCLARSLCCQPRQRLGGSLAGRHLDRPKVLGQQAVGRFKLDHLGHALALSVPAAPGKDWRRRPQ
jgi:hypothetical protein